MLKGLRWPFLALVLASALLGLAVVTRPSASTPGAAPEPATATPPPTLIPTPEPPAAPGIEPASPEVIEPAAPPDILVEALVGNIRKLNPLLATYNPVDRDITSLIFEGLTTTNQYGEIIPDLAASWTVSADGLEYVFVLRDDVLWQDGIPFTAEDVVYTISAMSDPDFPGAESLHEFWRTIEAEALSEVMVRFRLTQPLASFPDQLRIGIVPAHVLANTPLDQLETHPFNLSPIGTGPYQLETLTASGGQIDGVQLRVAPVYRQRPEGAAGYALDRIVFRTYPTAEAALDAFRRGEVNSISSIPPALHAAAQQVPNLSLYTAIEPHVGVLIYNWENDAMRFVRNPRARLALAHAVDRAALVARYLSGRAILADSPLLPDSWAYEPGIQWPEYDLAQAQSMLETVNLEVSTPAPEEMYDTGEPPAEAEQPPAEGDSAEPSETPEAEATPEPPAPAQPQITILTVDDPALVGMANDIAASWGQIGFLTSVESVGADKLQARLEAGDFDAAIVELSFEPNADPDPFVFWHQGQYESGQNYGGADDRRISEALENARRDSYGINRVAHYHRFQELFAERVPALVLYYPLYTYAADERLQGVQLGFLSSPSDRFRTIQNWTFTGG